MRRLARTQTTAGVSLFPFLAVLLCTMGALIVVLVVIARQARLQVAAAQSSVRENQGALDAELADLRWRTDVLRESRAKTSDQLAERQRELSHLEDHTRRLRAQLAELQTAQDELSRSRGLGESSALREQLANVESRRAVVQAELDQFIKTDGTRRDSYAVIPYRGPNQTQRRPIYIECRRDAIIFQPEGLTLTEEDFAIALGPGNPLAAGLRAAREHLLLTGAPGEREGEPYPLLLVRPDGIVAYYAARAAMQSWGSDFGYELVDREWSLEFPPSDRGLFQAMRLAIDDARQKQALLALANPRRARDPDRPTFRVSPSKGGLVREDGPARSGSSSLAGRDRYAGSVGGAGGQRKRDPFNDENDAPWVGAESGGQRGAGGPPGGAGDDPVPSNPYATVTAGTGAASSAGDGDHLLAGGGRDGAAAAGGDRYASGSAAGGDGTSGEIGGESFLAPTAAAGDAAQPHGSAKGERGSTVPTGASETRDPTATATSRPGEYRERGQSSETGRPVAASAVSASDSGRSANGQRGATSASGSPQAGRSGAPGQGEADQASGPGSVDLNRTTSAKSIAEVRGKNWGLPDAAVSSVPVTRAIHVICDSDHLTILPERRYGRDTKVIAFHEHTEDSVDELVSSTWERIDSWGIAGRGMYWRPTLTMDVEPGGEQRFADLQALLAGSGMEVKGRPARRSGPRYPRTQSPF